MKAKPNFFIIGAAKAATTSLSSLLASHHQAAIVHGKEPHFFSSDERYKLGWSSYLKLFKHCKTEAAIGDASTSYSRIRYYPLTVERIRRDVPDAKIIYMVRHPIERMESACIEHFCTSHKPMLKSVNDAVRRQPTIVDSSRYWEVFNAYREKFSESRIKIVWFEDYVRDTVAVFQDICRFLEIDDSVIPDFEHEQLNSRRDWEYRLGKLGRASASFDLNWQKEVRREIVDQIREDNCSFLAYFCRPRDFWGNIFD